MIDNLLKELEKIKDIKSKKEFLERALKIYSDKKQIESIKKLIKDIEKAEKERIEKEKKQEKKENVQDIITPRGSAQLNITGLEEAPKYEPKTTDSNTQIPRNNRPFNQENISDDLRSDRTNDLERIAGLEDRRRDTGRREEFKREELSEYVAMLSGNMERGEEIRKQRLYKNPEYLRAEIQKRDIDTRRSYDSTKARVEDSVLRRSIEEVRSDYTPFNREEQEEQQIKRFTENIKPDSRFIEDIHQKYSVDVVENLKKQKKQLEDKYL
jgi:hypothetical protein